MKISKDLPNKKKEKGRKDKMYWHGSENNFSKGTTRKLSKPLLRLLSNNCSASRKPMPRS